VIRVLIFDFGGVLVRFMEREERRQWDERMGLPPGGMGDLLYGGGEWDLAGTGQISDEEFWQRIEAKVEPSRKEDFRAFQEVYFSARYRDQQLIEWIEAHRGQYRIGLLSNATSALEPYLDELGVGRLFDVVINSARVGHLKPDSAIYEIALDRLGVVPGEAIFVDDLPWNVEAATGLGIHAIHHLATEATLAQLEALLDRDSQKPAPPPLRPARQDDLPALCALAQAVRDEVWWGPLLPVARLAERDDGWLEDPHTLHRVAGEGKMEGMLLLSPGRTPLDRHVAEVSLAVHPEARRRGLAGRLLAEGTTLAQEQGVEILRATICADNGAARCLLAQCGFEQEAALEGHLRRPDGASRDLLMFAREMPPRDRNTG